MRSKKSVSGWRRKLALVLTAVLVTAGAAALAPATSLGATEAYAATAASQGQWVSSNGGWWYRNADGSYPKSCWQEIDGKWYHFDSAGWMQTGWLQDGGNWYYLDASGASVKYWQAIGGKWYYFDYEWNAGYKMISNTILHDLSSGGLIKLYYFAPDGSMVTGWYYVGHTGNFDIDGWIYCGTDGAMQFGWQKIDGKWYFLKGSYGSVINYASLATGWFQPDFETDWYYSDQNGVMQTGWLAYGGSWYYLTDSGKMATGWQLVNGTWYWFAQNGAMATGWQKIDGSWYYLSGSGAMLHDCWVGNYYLGSSGAMLTNAWTPDGYYVGVDGVWVPGE